MPSYTPFNIKEKLHNYTKLYKQVYNNFTHLDKHTQFVKTLHSLTKLYKTTHNFNILSQLHISYNQISTTLHNTLHKFTQLLFSKLQQTCQTITTSVQTNNYTQRYTNKLSQDLIILTKRDTIVQNYTTLHKSFFFVDKTIHNSMQHL